MSFVIRFQSTLVDKGVGVWKIKKEAMNNLQKCINIFIRIDL